ncbi:MAG TPA: FecR domain-containing protein [Bryobacteraceae bacterium]|nr:FecR domain-containing protein [Bryobacteraceae bacterium]
MSSSRSFGQSVVSVRSGLINYSEGDVLVNGQPLQRRFGTYVSLKAGSDLVTRSGRAELLLTPNTYLRVGSDSAIRMVADSLADTQVELLGGSAVLDSSGAPGKTPLTITVHNSTVRFLDPGKFRVDSDPAQLRVFSGNAEVDVKGDKVKIERSQLLPLGGAPIVQRFTEGSDNLLDLWSDERHSMISSRLSDAQNIGNPLTDPDPLMAGVYADPGSGAGYIPGYIPLMTPPPLMGGSPGGLYGGPAMRNYGTVVFNPYGINSPYDVNLPYGGIGVYGGAGYPAGLGIYGAGIYGGLYAPLYGSPLRPGLVGVSPSYPSGMIGVRPGSSIGVGSFNTFSPRPLGVGSPVGGGAHSISAPHPIAVPHVGPHR